jgi:hypothetical protein
MVKGSLYALLSINVLLTIVSFVAGSILMGTVIVVFTIVLAIMLFKARHHLQLISDLIGVASE